MSITLKTGQIKARTKDGMTPIDCIVGDTAEQINAIKEAGAQTLETIPDDYTELVNDVNQLKSDIGELQNAATKMTVLSDLRTYNAYMTSTSAPTWNLLSDANAKLIPVKDGVVCNLKANFTFYFAFLKSDANIGTNGASVDIASGSVRTACTSGASVNVTAPQDATLLWIGVTSGSIDDAVDSVVVGGYDITVEFRDAVVSLEEKIESMWYETGNAVITGNIAKFLPKPSIGFKYSSTGVKVTNNSGAIIEKFTVPCDMDMATSSNVSAERKVIFNQDGSVSSVINNDGTNAFFRLSKGEIVGISFYKNDFTVTSDNFYDNVSFSKVEHSDINWISLGDSITQGVYSYKDGETVGTHTDKSKSYCKTIQRLTGWNLTNKGLGGIGWLMRETNSGAKKNIVDVIADIDFTKFNLCTIALGVNDWKGPVPFGTIEDTMVNTSVYANVKYTIEYILSANPAINIVVITPMNCAVYSMSSEEGNWGLGYANADGKTLEDMFNLIVDVCDYYGIKYIDNTHRATVNRRNLKSLLLDNIHPSEVGHQLIGQRLAREIC